MRFCIILILSHAAIAQHSLLPNQKETPGAVNPLITQKNIKQTICKAGWTRTVRPIAKYTDELKIQQMKQRGLTGDPHKFEEDHLIPLSLGGAPSDPNNLWPEPWPE